MRRRGSGRGRRMEECREQEYRGMGWYIIGESQRRSCFHEGFGTTKARLTLAMAS